MGYSDRHKVASELTLTKNQTNELCKREIMVNPDNIKYVNNKTDELCKFAIDRSPYSILHIKVDDIGINRWTQMVKYAISKNRDVYRYFKQPVSEEINLFVVELDPFYIQYIDHLSNKLLTIAIDKNPLCIQNVSRYKLIGKLDICAYSVYQYLGNIHHVPFTEEIIFSRISEIENMGIDTFLSLINK